MKTGVIKSALLLFAAAVLSSHAAPTGVWQVDSSFTLVFEQSVEYFQIQHPLPLETDFQAPLDFEVFVQPPTKRAGLSFQKDDYGNRIAVLTINPCEKGERVQVEFHSKVLVSPRSYENLPNKIPFPKKWPKEAQQWLSSSFCVESTNAAFLAIAQKTRSSTTDLREVIKHCIRESDEIRWRANEEAPPHSNQTAIHALRYKVVCTGSANLLAALLRSCGIPARILGGAPTRSKSVATHFIVEAYLPDFGWYPIEPTLLQEALEPQSQINWSIAVPEYETEQKAGWRSYIGGGVPYLSCNEINLPRGAIRYIGGIDDMGADNRATLVLALASERKDWKRIMTIARQHWKELEKNAGQRDGANASSFDQFMRKINIATDGR